MTTEGTEKDFRFTLGEEIANSISHGAGAVASLIACPFLVSAALKNGDAGAIIGTVIFLATSFLLYLTSTLYHALAFNRAKKVFQILDHSAIFLLIAGTYTPFALGVLHGVAGWTLFLVVWGLAALGVTLKAMQKIKYAWLSTALYVCMGWLCIGVAEPLISSLSLTAIVWLAIGGSCYTGGVLFFIFDEKIRYSHFLWHLFVLAGTVAHFFAVYYALIYTADSPG